MLWVFFLLFSKYFKKKKEKKKKNTRKKTHSPGQQTRHCFKTISVTVTVRTGVQWERERKEQRHWGQIGTLGATINQLYQSLMESSQWQNGNYSTGCVMLAWHLFCHWLPACPCGEQSTDQWEGKKRGDSGTGNWLFVTSWVFTVTAMLTSVITTSSRHCPH